MDHGGRHSNAPSAAPQTQQQQQRHQQQHTPPLPLVPEPKRHAACDECRIRKLKCSGHRPACDRCARENLLPCVYSPQKQMGRPRKRRRGDEDSSDVNGDGVQNGIGSRAPTAKPPPVAHVGAGTGLQVHYKEHRSGSGESGVGLGAELMGFGGFEGFTFGDAGVNRGGVNEVGADVFELDPNFSLDPLLTGELMGDIDGNNGVLAHQQQTQSVGTMSSHETPPAVHDRSASQQSFLPTTAVGLPCACLSNIYLMLSSLHGISSHDFPFVLPTLRNAISTANTVLNCPHCPLSFATASQNIHMLISLLMTLIDNVYKVLTTIDAEAQRVDAVGAKKPFVLADASAPAHMHSGAPDCPVRFGMELSGAEWRDLARKVVKSQIIGNAAEAEAGGCEGTVYGTLAAFVRRQNRWHEEPAMLEIKRNAVGGGIPGMEELGQGRLCVQNVEHVAARLKLLDI